MAESEYQYSYTAIKDYLADGVYPDGYEKQYKHGLRKRSKYFILDGGHLMYCHEKFGPVSRKSRDPINLGTPDPKIIVKSGSPL